ncbi:hypothetical protein JHK85_056772 [Glycine max]|uniref:Uncharacterized protein n=1 Tax=Glycine soja TaxID=3848 RepID=A0A0B2R2S8_GLYSO|nr:hypothetical protein JHK85_056772 [Glycine max]KHN26192.1 hypothetical protein glysoja_035485 [Glycine soja]
MASSECLMLQTYSETLQWHLQNEHLFTKPSNENIPRLAISYVSLRHCLKQNICCQNLTSIAATFEQSIERSSFMNLCIF